MKRPEGLGMVSKKKKFFFGRQFVFLLVFVQGPKGRGIGRRGEGEGKEGRRWREAGEERGKVAKSGRRREAPRGGREGATVRGFFLSRHKCCSTKEELRQHSTDS